MDLMAIWRGGTCDHIIFWARTLSVLIPLGWVRWTTMCMLLDI